MAVPVIIPKQGQSVETCIIIDWYVKKGEAVSKGDLLYTFETDKSSFDEEAPEDGILLDIFYDKGVEAPVLATVGVIGKEGESVEEYIPQKYDVRSTKYDLQNEQQIAHPSNYTPLTPLKRGISQEGSGMKVASNEEQSTINDQINISPRANRLAAKMNININSVRGTGPGGRITERDVEEYINVSSSKSQGPSSKKHETWNIEHETEADCEIRKLSNMRQIISGRIYDSLQNSVQITHHSSADARKIIDYRNKIKEGSQQPAASSQQTSNKTSDITLNDLICFAVIKALKKKPEINSHFMGDSIKTFKKVHLGFAVNTERGLMVPVIRNADELDIKGLSEQFKLLAESCRKGNIDPELTDSSAASFTVTNLGMYGIEMFTPILNLPQAGILGINTIIQRPVKTEGGKTEVIPFVGLSLTYDHRAIDGAPASEFLREVKEQIEVMNFEL